MFSGLEGACCEGSIFNHCGVLWLGGTGTGALLS